MPIYLYRNLTTNETFELEQRITASALTHHPESGDPVKRLIQPVGIAFKGSGFYVNDSRSNNSASKTGKADKTESKSESSGTSGEGKSESKADSKSESKSDSKSEGKESKTEKKSESKAASAS